MNSSNRRQRQRVKDTATLSPKGTATGNARIGCSCIANHRVAGGERAPKFCASLQSGTWKACRSPGNRKMRRKAALMGLQVEEVVKSKDPPVMGRIQSYLWRESEPTYHRSFIARRSEEPLRRNANDNS